MGIVKRKKSRLQKLPPMGCTSTDKRAEKNKRVKKMRSRQKREAEMSYFPTIDEPTIRDIRHRVKMNLGNSKIKTVPIGTSLIMTGERPVTRELRWREGECKSLIFEDNLHFRLIRLYGREAEHAISIIQRNWRIKLKHIYKKKAATKIQSMIRLIRPKKQLFHLRQWNKSKHIQRVFRGFRGRKVALHRRKMHLSATVIQRIGRGYVLRKKLYMPVLKRMAGKIQSFWRKILHAWFITDITTIQSFFRAMLAVKKYKICIHSANKIGEFWKKRSYELKLMRVREAFMEEIKQNKASETIQRSWRIFVARRILSKKRKEVEPLKSFLETYQIDDCTNVPNFKKLVLWHLLSLQHLSLKKGALDDIYREELMQNPDTVELVYGRAINAMWERKSDSCTALLEEAQALDNEERSIWKLIKGILMLAVKKHRESGNEAYSVALTHYALAERIVDRNEDSAVTAFEKIERLASNELPCHKTSIKHAEKFLARYKRDIFAGAFFSKPYIKDKPIRISGIAGKISVWCRGLNFRFEFSKPASVSENEGKQNKKKRRRESSAKKYIKKELILDSKAVRLLAFRLDRRDLLQPCNRLFLLEKILSFLSLTRDRDSGKQSLVVCFQQEPFPKMTRLAKSTNSFLSIVAYPWESDSNLALDLKLHAIDTKRGEEHTVKASQSLIEELFADKAEWLRARKRPGWRKASRCLVSKLVDLLDIVEIEVPHKGDFVLLINPEYKSLYKAGKRSRGSYKLPNWYKVGVVRSQNKENYEVLLLDEVEPNKSKLFKETKNVINLCLDDLRIAQVEKQSSHQYKLLTSVQNEFFDNLDKPFRKHPARRKMIMHTEQRKKDATLYCAARNIQRIYRGYSGRRYTDRFRRTCARNTILKNWRHTVLINLRLKKIQNHIKETRSSILIQAAWRKTTENNIKQKNLDRIAKFKNLWLENVSDDLDNQEMEELQSISRDFVLVYRKLRRLTMQKRANNQHIDID